jgi:hypothetical protein
MPPVPAFRDVVDVPMIVRKVHRSRQQVNFFHSVILLEAWQVLSGMLPVDTEEEADDLFFLHLMVQEVDCLSRRDWEDGNSSHFIKWYLLLHAWLAQVRKDLGISENVKVLLFNFGGQVLLLTLNLAPRDYFLLLSLIA